MATSPRRLRRGALLLGLLASGASLLAAAPYPVTVAQIAGSDPAATRDLLREVLLRTPAPGLVVLPEFLAHEDGLSPAALRGPDGGGDGLAARLRGSVPASAVEELARETARAVVYGLLTREGGAPRSRVVFFDPVSDQRETYDRTHVLAAEAPLTPGDRLRVFETRFGRLGLLASRDVDGPEAARVLALAGAEVLAVVGDEPPSRPPERTHRALSGIAAHSGVHVLWATRARAGRARRAGYSAIYSPTGKRLDGVKEDRVGVATAAVDLLGARALREAAAARGVRRPALYAPLTRGAPPLEAEPSPPPPVALQELRDAGPLRQRGKDLSDSALEKAAPAPAPPSSPSVSFEADSTEDLFMGGAGPGGTSVDPGDPGGGDDPHDPTNPEGGMGGAGHH